MGAGRPKNTKGGSVSYDKRRNRYVAQFYLVDNKTHVEKRQKKTFLTEEEAKDFLNTMQYQKGNEIFIKKISFFGRKYYSAFAPILTDNIQTNWGIGFLIPESTYMLIFYYMRVILIAISVIVLILAIIFSNFYAASLSAPINTISKAMHDISQGDLVIEDVSAKEREIITSRKDELGRMGNSLNEMIASLLHIIQIVRESAMQVMAGGEQLSSSSQAVSAGASEQAASTEEMSATMEQMTSNIRQTAENIGEFLYKSLHQKLKIHHQ